MVIISVVTGVTVLSFNTDNSPRELERESRRFFQVLRLLADEAVLQNKEFGLEVFDDGYRFLYFDFDGNEWLEFDDQALFSPYLIPEKMRLVLYSQDIPFELGQIAASASDTEGTSELQSADKQDVDKQTEKKPSVWFLSSGEVTPFEIEFSLQDDSIDSYTITVDDFGQLVLDVPNEDA